MLEEGRRGGGGEGTGREGRKDITDIHYFSPFKATDIHHMHTYVHVIQLTQTHHVMYHRKEQRNISVNASKSFLFFSL